MDPITFVLLDGSTTTYDVCVSVDGVDISQFEKNPVMFYQHNDWNMPVGKWENIRKVGGQLLADAVFDYEDTDKDVQRMIKKVEKGFIKMASCGLVDLECSSDPMLQMIDGCCMMVTKSRLREASIVPIGGNHNAIRLYDNTGKEIDLKQDAGLKLTDFIVKPKIKIMDKELLTLLNLSDTATPAEQIERVQLLLSDKLKAENELEAEKLKATAALQLADERKAALDAIELADKTAKKTAFEAELTLALADGRLTEKEDGSVKASMLLLFDANGESTMNMLKGLTPHKSISLELGDQGGTKLSAFEKRKQEIDAANAAKKAKK